MQMDERKLRILRAIIDDYIMTAVPVGSRTISRKYDIGGLSSATIRNEMSDLEELGYLDQPHTSAGRIPSTKAYRLYAEQILSGAPKLEPEEIVQLRGYFDQRIQQVEGVIRSAAQAMADVTHYTTVVMAPQTRGMRIRHVQLVPVHENSALLVLVTDTGMVKEIMLHIDANLDPDHLYMISKMLTAQLAGRTLGEIRASLSQMARSMREHAGFFGQVLGALESTQQDVHPAEMVIGGSANILSYPEYNDVEKARAFLTVLETREKVVKLLAGGQYMEFSIRIGPETGMPEMQDCSVISATYRIGNDTMGTIGVIGPTRMHYARVISVLDYMGKSLSELLGGQE